MLEKVKFGVNSLTPEMARVSELTPQGGRRDVCLQYNMPL